LVSILFPPFGNTIALSSFFFRTFFRSWLSFDFLSDNSLAEAGKRIPFQSRPFPNTGLELLSSSPFWCYDTRKPRVFLAHASPVGAPFFLIEAALSVLVRILFPVDFDSRSSPRFYFAQSDHFLRRQGDPAFPIRAFLPFFSDSFPSGPRLFFISNDLGSIALCIWWLCSGETPTAPGRVIFSFSLTLFFTGLYAFLIRTDDVALRHRSASRPKLCESPATFSVTFLSLNHSSILKLSFFSLAFALFPPPAS